LVNAERSGMEGINAVTQECPEEYDLWYLALWILKVKNKDLTPKGLYGATKLCAEKIFVQGNSYAGAGGARFSCSRYGNVVGSRGSVIPLFLKQKNNGLITITDERMTRFWITLEQGVRFVIRCIEMMHGGEVFVPKIPSMQVSDLAKAVAPECEIEFIGIRPGEKVHESLISEDEARCTLEFDDMYVVQPLFAWWGKSNWDKGKTLPEGFRYTSDTNSWWLTEEELKRIVKEMEKKEIDEQPFGD